MGRVRNVKQTVLVCVDLFPRLRELQHRAFDSIDKMLKEESKKMQQEVSESEEKVAEQMKERLEMLKSVMGGELREILIKKVRELASGLQNRHNFKVGISVVHIMKDEKAIRILKTVFLFVVCSEKCCFGKSPRRK